MSNFEEITTAKEDKNNPLPNNKNNFLEEQRRLDKEEREQKLNQTKLIFYWVGYSSILFLLCFLIIFLCVGIGAIPENSIFIRNKFSLSLLALLAIIPTLWISIIICGLYNIKDKGEKSSFPVKDIMDTTRNNLNL